MSETFHITKQEELGVRFTGVTESSHDKVRTRLSVCERPKKQTVGNCVPLCKKEHQHMVSEADDRQ